MLALDMDGTILNDDGVLTSAVIEDIQKAQEKNCIVCFVTGRREIDIAPIEKLCKNANYLLLNNGTKIVNAKNDEVLFHQKIEEKTLEALVNYCLTENILLYVTAGLFWGVNYLTEGVSRYSAKLGRKPFIYKSCRELPLDKVDGLMVTDSGAHIEKFLEEQGLPLYCMQSEPNCIDLMVKGVGKWAAIEFLSKRLGIKTDSIVAVGNYNNDIEMIKNAGIGIAVANALPIVKEVADYVTCADNNHNPVKEVVQRFILETKEVGEKQDEVPTRN